MKPTWPMLTKNNDMLEHFGPLSKSLDQYGSSQGCVYMCVCEINISLSLLLTWSQTTHTHTHTQLSCVSSCSIKELLLFLSSPTYTHTHTHTHTHTAISCEQIKSGMLFLFLLQGDCSDFSGRAEDGLLFFPDSGSPFSSFCYI